jgi:hypothetical protein
MENLWQHLCSDGNTVHAIGPNTCNSYRSPNLGPVPDTHSATVITATVVPGGRSAKGTVTTCCFTHHRNLHNVQGVSGGQVNHKGAKRTQVRQGHARVAWVRTMRQNTLTRRAQGGL